MVYEVLLLGHSFVRRLDDLVTSGTVARNLGLDPQISKLGLLVIGGLALSRRRHLHLADSVLMGKDLVVTDIGSNVIVLCRLISWH